ncbi:hypothetical protein [Streptomonospora arabica]|uniref:Uncharacterized protein n=1 Tax=Streptomonospora arabica TaxID=412417 RepID=A0ABV9SSM4_9ACTN
MHVTPPLSSFPTPGWHEVTVDRYDTPPPTEYRAGCLTCRWMGSYFDEERDANAEGSRHENPAHRNRT